MAFANLFSFSFTHQCSFSLPLTEEDDERQGKSDKSVNRYISVCDEE